MTKRKGYLTIEILFWISFSCIMMIFVPPIINSFEEIKLKLYANELVMNIRSVQSVAINKYRSCNVKFVNAETESFYYIYHTINERKEFILPRGIKFKFKTGNTLIISYNSEGHPARGDSLEITNGEDTYSISINPNVGRVVMRKC